MIPRWLGAAIVGAASLVAARPAAASAPDATWLGPWEAGAFVRVRGGAFREVPCGKGAAFPGSAMGSTWTAVDAWGQPTAALRVAGSHVYDLSDCRELELTLVKGRIRGAPLAHGTDPVALHVHANGGFVPAPSLRCRPDLEASFRAFARKRGAGDPARPPQLFCAPGRGGETVVRGVAGGARLVVGKLDARGRWVAQLVDRQASRFDVLGVFDMNGDGRPEIIVHRARIDTYDDAIYTIDPAGGVRVAFESVGSGYA